jgi:hypothetical protein
MSPSSALKRAADASPTEIPMLIGGEWRPGAETYEVRDPYRIRSSRTLRAHL